jgi:sulfur oxidation c-type cytochrome SoxX
MSQLTLSRFFVLHIGIFIPALILLIGMHIAAFRTTGVVGPWKEEKRRKKGPFWPDQAFKDLVVGTFVFFVLVTLCVFAPPPFTGPADPSNTTYLPKPEWNFLFLYEALKYFQGPLEPIGTAGVPAVLIALLVLLPFIDRSPERNPFRRPVAMACLLVYSGVILTLTVIGYLSPGYAQMPERPAASGQAVTETHGLQTVPSKPSEAKPDEEKPAPSEAQKPSGTKLGKTVPVVEGDIEQGKQLFHSLPCIQCHSIEGKGGTIGPALTHEQLEGKSRNWLHDQIRDPKLHNPNSVMPAFKDLSDEQVDALVDYLVSIAGTSAGVRSSTQSSESLKKEQAEKSTPKQQETRAVSQMSAPPSAPAEKIPGPAAYIIGDPENGALLFQEQCAQCHGKEGKGGVPNPGSDDGTVPSLNPIDPALSDQNPPLFAEKIDKIIQHGSIAAGPHPVLHMPDWGDSRSLTQEQIANIEAYILSLNGVERGKLIHPGMEPVHFFILTVVVFAAAIFLLGGLWVRKIRQACRGE